MEKMHVQPPLSTAYLSSVPAKKRKVIYYVHTK